MSTISRLPKELLKLILEDLDGNPEESVPVYRRRFLSQESLVRPAPPPIGCMNDIANFRRTCKGFAELGAEHLFACVVARFTDRELDRLDTLAQWPHVAVHVKRFSYLAPYFFMDQNMHWRDSRRLANNRDIDLGLLRQKAAERQRIITEQKDARVIKKAVLTFDKLRHVRILPLMDNEQFVLLRLLREEPALRHSVDLDWTPALYHCSRIIGTALLKANKREIQFSYPKLSPQNAQFFWSKKSQAISNLASNLTTLTLQFEEVDGLDDQVRELSHLFKTVFSTAENMRAIHIGFLTTRPLNLPLEDVFQNVTWKNLVALGVDGWNLEANEIVNLAFRHSKELKGLRLRRVYLKEESRWKSVLGHLRDGMEKLDWISLTGIGYAHDDGPASVAEVPADALIDDDSEEDEVNGDDIHVNENPNRDEDFYGDSSDSENEDRTGIREIEYLNIEPSGRSSYSVRCNCAELRAAASPESLDDNGGPISRDKAKFWERWVVNRCRIHGSR